MILEVVTICMFFRAGNAVHLFITEFSCLLHLIVLLKLYQWTFYACIFIPCFLNGIHYIYVVHWTALVQWIALYIGFRALLHFAMHRIVYIYFAGRFQSFKVIFNLPLITLLFSSLKVVGNGMSWGRNCRSGRATDKIDLIIEPSGEGCTKRKMPHSAVSEVIDGRLGRQQWWANWDVICTKPSLLACKQAFLGRVSRGWGCPNVSSSR